MPHLCAADAISHLSGRPLTLILRLIAGFELQGLGLWVPGRARSAAVRYLPLEPRAACLPARGRVSHTLSHPVVRCSQLPPQPCSVRAAPLACCGGSLLPCMVGGVAMLGSARRGAARPQEWLPSRVASEGRFRGICDACWRRARGEPWGGLRIGAWLHAGGTGSRGAGGCWVLVEAARNFVPGLAFHLAHPFPLTRSRFPPVCCVRA